MEVRGKNATTRGPSDWFTGDMFIDSVGRGLGDAPVSVGLVHFTPGARTAWHSHSVGQSLYVTEGEGRVQARGEPVVVLQPGDTLFAPGGEWHWHGAAPDHLMTHLAVSEGEASWGDHVTDEEYRS